MRPCACILVLLAFNGGLRASGPAGAGSGAGDRLRVISDLRTMRGIDRGTAQATRPGKCGLEMGFRVLDRWKEFSESEKGLVRALLAPPLSQKSRIVGRFHFYYDTTGSDSPALLDASNQRIPGSAEAYVDSAGRILNHVWDAEINSLGYSPPPLRADSAYPVSIHDLSPGLYGETFPDPDPIGPGSPPRYLTTIEVDNDFREGLYFSKGLRGLEVTCAHEFHHAIQLGAYGYWGDAQRYIYEITSTWMEDEVYTDVNDYYQYLSNDVNQTSQFSTPDIRFTRTDQSIEYSRAVWGKFIEKRFSSSTMRRMWEHMRDVSSLDAIERAVGEAGSTLRAAFLEYAYWNLNTGPAADTLKFYSEGMNYPPMRIASTVDYLPPGISFQDSIGAMSSDYHKICLLTSASDSCGDKNSMVAIVSNVDAPNGYSDLDYPFTYTLSSAPSEGARELRNAMYVTLDVADPQVWSSQETIPTAVPDVLVFPSPYQSTGGGLLWFRLPATPVSPTATLSVFTSSMTRVYSGTVPVLAFRPQEPALSWNGRTDRGESIATGVYLYFISVDETDYFGKFAAIRN
jgi:hypothetical protein